MLRKKAKEILQQQQRPPPQQQQPRIKQEQIEHTFPYLGLSDEERAKELHEDEKFFHDVLSGEPDDEYSQQRLRETENELHKLYERGIGGYIAGSIHDPDRVWYLRGGAACC
jgi:hypothetical protein